MIKAALSVDGKHTLLLGLSAENRKRLGQDMPIRITREMLAEMDLPDELEIVLIGGETEEEMAAMLVAQGFGRRE